MRDNLEILLSHTGDVALRRRARWLIENLSLKNKDKVLDLGCGDGYYLFLLSNLGINVNLIGLDNYKPALASAKKNLKSKKIRLIFSNASRLPFKTNYFDKVVASEVLEHVSNDLKVVSEVRRVLKPGGIFVLSVPHANYPFFGIP